MKIVEIHSREIVYLFAQQMDIALKKNVFTNFHIILINNFLLFFSLVKSQGNVVIFRSCSSGEKNDKCRDSKFSNSCSCSTSYCNSSVKLKVSFAQILAVNTLIFFFCIFFNNTK